MSDMRAALRKSKRHRGAPRRNFCVALQVSYIYFTACLIAY